MPTNLSGFITLTISALTLSGCIGGMLVSTATRSSYALYNTHVKADKIADVTMDPADIQQIRTQMIGVNHVAILADTEIAMSFADFWMETGKLATVLMEFSNPSALSLSQTKAALMAACKQSVDAAIFGRTGNPQPHSASTNGYPMASQVSTDLYVYSCQRKKLEISLLTIDFVTKKHTTTEQVDQIIGTSLAAKLVEITK